MKKLFYACLLIVCHSNLLIGQMYQKGVFTDSRDKQSYNTVKIGNQVWFAQNLNFATEEGSWPVEGDSAGMQYGRFYTWKSAKEAIPEGWHLPSKEEFELLAANLGIHELPNEDDLYPLLIEGGESGFNILLTGSHKEGYGQKGKAASFWSSDRKGLFRSPFRLSIRKPNYINIGHGAGSNSGFNVRCIKD